VSCVGPAGARIWRANEAKYRPPGIWGKAETHTIPDTYIRLAGVSVTVRDSAGAEHGAPLLFVSPSQIYYQVPDGLAEGLAVVSVANGHGA
jgi:uncharacterized protein (TIGR03437 family)